MLKKLFIFVLMLCLSTEAFGAISLVTVSGYDPNTQTYSGIDFNSTVVGPLYETIYIGVYSDNDDMYDGEWFGVDMNDGVECGEMQAHQIAGNMAEAKYWPEYEGDGGKRWWTVLAAAAPPYSRPSPGVQFVLPITITADVGTADVNLGWPTLLDSLEIQAPGPWSYYTLSMAVEPNDIGIDTLNPAVGDHQCYFEVAIQAQDFLDCPDIHRFDHWEGDGISDVNSAITTVVMDANRSVTAVYVAVEKECGDECHPILQGDLNEDCYINFEDFTLYCEQWLGCTHPDCDP